MRLVVGDQIRQSLKELVIANDQEALGLNVLTDFEMVDGTAKPSKQNTAEWKEGKLGSFCMKRVKHGHNRTL